MKIEVDKEYLEQLEHDHRILKQTAEAILYKTVAGGNGGYYSQFGPMTFSTMIKITGFDPKKRRIKTMAKLTPKTANTVRKISKLVKDHIGYKGYWILVEAKSIILNKQKVNEPRTEKITMPKSVFERFIKFYKTGE